MNTDVAHRKSRLLALASGLLVLLVIGEGLLHPNSPATALTEAQANATQEEAARQANATHEEATWRAFATYAPDKATQRAVQQLTATFLPTPTWFDAFATGEALDKMLTTSPTPGPTDPPTLFFQRPAGAGRLIIPLMSFCGHDLQCSAKNFWMEKTQDKFITVYAGSRFNEFTDAYEALIEIEWLALGNRNAPIKGGGVFLTPVTAQDLIILDVVGEQLLLRTNEGTLLLFDVPSQQYISVPQSQLAARMQHQVDGGAIVEKNDVPFTRPGFSALNRWSGKNAQGRITVFAGADGGSSNNLSLGKGVLAVVTSKGEPGAADPPQLYYPPQAVQAALWIFDVKGNRVALLDPRGGKYFFDLATRQFFSQFDERANVFAAPLFDPNMPTSQATPAPVTPFVPPVSTPVLTAGSNAYP
jgi:hypothetical protein